MTTPTVRRVALLTLVFCLLGLSPVEGGPSKESKHVAKYGAMPFYDRYLYPGGGVPMSVGCLSRPEERVMTLTFDDGPDEKDLKISALLQKEEIPATFFYIGSKTKGMFPVAQKILADHHVIGYHAHRHRMLSWFSPSNLKEDFRQGQEAMDSLGVSPTWFRPPYGDFNGAVVQAAKDRGMETILWTIDSRDWSGIPADTMARNVTRQFHPGAVLLFHSTRANTLQALPEVLKVAKSKNYRFVSLDEWRRIIQAANCRELGRFCPPSSSVGVVATRIRQEEGIIAPP